MKRYHVNVPENPDEREERARTVARAVLEASQREVSEIELLGLTDKLREHEDSSAVDALSTEPSLTVEETEMYGTVSATPENIEAVLTLFSGSLFKAVFKDESGDQIFSRNDISIIDFYLMDEESNNISNYLQDEYYTYVEIYNNKSNSTL